MKTCLSIRSLGLALAVSGALFAAQAADVFDFIPQGGRSLLARVLAGRKADDIRTVVAGKHTRDEWVADLRGRGAQFPAAQRLSDKELLTLADYMAFNLPLPAAKVPANPSNAAWDKLLPMD